MKLFEISDQIEGCIAAGVDEHGEITQEALEALEELEGELKAKALAVAAYIKGERVEAKAIEEVASDLIRRAARHRARAESLEGYLATHLEPGLNLEDANVEIRWRKSTAVGIQDAALIPADLMERKPAPPATPAKKLILAKLRCGEEIPGAMLIHRNRLSVK